MVDFVTIRAKRGKRRMRKEMNQMRTYDAPKMRIRMKTKNMLLHCSLFGDKPLYFTAQVGAYRIEFSFIYYKKKLDVREKGPSNAMSYLQGFLPTHHMYLPTCILKLYSLHTLCENQAKASALWKRASDSLPRCIILPT